MSEPRRRRPPRRRDDTPLPSGDGEYLRLSPRIVDRIQFWGATGSGVISAGTLITLMSMYSDMTTAQSQRDRRIDANSERVERLRSDFENEYKRLGVNIDSIKTQIASFANKVDRNAETAIELRQALIRYNDLQEKNFQIMAARMHGHEEKESHPGAPTKRELELRTEGFEREIKRLDGRINSIKPP